MHIDVPRQEFLDAQKTRQSLEQFLLQATPNELPPCPACNNHLPSTCSPKCSDAKLALSTEPDQHPIEANVLPLVYGLVSTRVFQTCWSCEGHMDSKDNLISLPRVSFYTPSCVYVQLLHRHLANLIMDKKLVYSWLIALSDYAQTWGQTYSLLPDLNYNNKDVHLGALQNDLKVIASDLQENMKIQARAMLLELDKWIEKNKATSQR